MSRPTDRQATTTAPAGATVVGFQERRLGQSVLRTYPRKLDIDDIAPNENLPLEVPEVDLELQRQIIENRGVFEPLLVESHPDEEGMYLIIDGDRRWANTRALVRKGHTELRNLPADVIDQTLTREERLRAWVYIHRQRKEWNAREKEMVAYRLVESLEEADAARILGVPAMELNKLVNVFELSKRFTGLQEPGASLTWARELYGLAKHLLTPDVVDAVVDKVNSKRITNSKDLRKLRQILRNDVAAQHFLTEAGDIESAMLRLARPMPQLSGCVADDMEALVAVVEQYNWSELSALKGDQALLEKISEAHALLGRLMDDLER